MKHSKKYYIYLTLAFLLLAFGTYLLNRTITERHIAPIAPETQMGVV